MARLSLRLTAGLLLLALAAAPRDGMVLGPSANASEDKPAEKSEGKLATPAGTWKVYLPFLRDGGDKALWLVKLEKKESGWSGEVLAKAARFQKATLEKIAVGDDLRFTLKLPDLAAPCVIKLPKGATDRLRGVAMLGQDATPIELEKTAVTSLDPLELLKETLSKQPLGQEAVKTALTLLGNSDAKKVKPVEVRAWAEKAVKSAELYGTAWQRDILLAVAEILLQKDGFDAVALQYARRGERMLEPKEAPAVQKRVLTVLATALEKAGKEADAKEVNARIAKLDFSIKPKLFAGRKGKSDRVVLVEEFTCASSPRCAAADMAFAALVKTFKPTEAALLQYHLHQPQPDPLACPDSEARFDFYENLRDLPSVAFNGKKVVSGGGGAEDATDRYDQYREAIVALLEAPAKAEIKLAATRKADKVSVTVEVANLAETGDDVRLRVVVAEAQAAYKGAGGVTVYPNVVRAILGGDGGTVLKEKTLKQTFSLDVEELRKKLKAALDKTAEKRPFPNKERPLEMKKLRVIAFVQNDKKDKNAEVLQAAQVDVQEAKE